jgi:hypothetical protein
MQVLEQERRCFFHVGGSDGDLWAEGFRCAEVGILADEFDWGD